MARIKKIPSSLLGYNFMDDLSMNIDQYSKRFAQGSQKEYRKLSDEEIIKLKSYNNYSSDWSKVLVTDQFIPKLIRNSKFYGLVRIGNITDDTLTHKQFSLSEGIFNSTIISSDIGDNCAIHDVKYLAYYIIGDLVMLHNVSEIQNTCEAHYGVGVKKINESESERIWIELGNETGARGILSFEKVKASDIYLMYKFKDDKPLQKRLLDLCQKEGKEEYGYYGQIEDECVIKATNFILNSNIGKGCYIKGANKIKDVTVLSDFDNPVQIGEGVELVHGIMQKGSKAFYGVKAVRFILSQNSTLKYGARLINSYLGDNSTISCCEVLNSFICPNHEQHHNNSFLVASTFLGQSNMAAGATVGSNHNSRANDGEIVAGRGFWPGLSVTLKHNSKFASFILIAKGSYPAELNIKIPFSLISNDTSTNKLMIMPAYWFMYNMYALSRNSWKFRNRDKRPDKSQNLEYNFLAPDSANEIVETIHFFESQKIQNGKILLEGKNFIENHNRGVEIIKVDKAIIEYKEQLILYFIESFLEVGQFEVPFQEKRTDWINIGNQLVTISQLEIIKSAIKKGDFSNWGDVHNAYLEAQNDYRKLKLINAYLCLKDVGIVNDFNQDVMQDLARKAVEVKEKNTLRIKLSREKDFTDSFRKITCDNEEEFREVFGTIDENSFVKTSEKELDSFKNKLLEFFPTSLK